MKTPACKNEFKSECMLQARLTISKWSANKYYVAFLHLLIVNRACSIHSDLTSFLHAGVFIHKNIRERAESPIHRTMCGAAPQNQHRAPQIDSASFFFLGFSDFEI